MGRSRYAAVDVAIVETADGVGGTRTVSCYRRRWPAGPTGSAAQPPAALHRVVAGDRLDLVSAKYLGDPLSWWNVADANSALDPDGLVAADAVGTVLVIPVPGF